MRPKVPFLTTTYGAYHQREVPGEDAELTHVGPGTPAGEYLRRFWQPVAHVEDMKDLPIAIRIMGEDLVVFRDNRGRIGLLQRHCSHRGTSLEYGVIEEKGIRCCYHGWLYDVDGTILETPRRAARQHLQGALVSRRLSGPRILRPRIRLHGARRRVSRPSRSSIRSSCRDTNSAWGSPWAWRTSSPATGSRSWTTSWTPYTSRSFMRAAADSSFATSTETR